MTVLAVHSREERTLFDTTLKQIGDLPPVHWLIHLGLWGYPPFSWIGSLLHLIFTQQALQWTETHLVWIMVSGLLMGFMTFELIFWAWSWVRGRQIGYDKYRATHWTTGPNAGKLKKKPVDLEKARARRFAWPLVGLPLYVVAVGMLTWYLLWPGAASRMLLAMLWFAFTPVRRVMAIAAARKAYRANHPNDTIETTLFEDVRAYFISGVSRPPHERRLIEPPFEDTGVLYRFLNWGHATFSRYGTFWRIFQFWNFLRFWGIVVQLVMAFFWPISAVAAPFYYMWTVEEYKNMINPWWRTHRNNKYHGNITSGAAAVKASSV